MKTIVSMLEDNIFSGILVKKGINNLSDKQYKVLTSSRHFEAACAKGFIMQFTPVSPEVKKAVSAIIPDFDTMSYNELKKYVKENNIEVPSMKKADILKAVAGVKHAHGGDEPAEQCVT